MKLDSVVPWGRSFEEYRAIFALSEDDLQKRLLGCGDGPACFNAELTQRGGNVVSVDPVYQFSSEQISSRIDEVYPQIMSQMEQNADRYIWENIKDVSELGQVRMTAMQQFLSDYESGLEAGRYKCASLPALPFEDQQFELALCSHFLFLYSDHLDLKQHIQGMKELCRVAAEVRVYPLLSLEGNQSEHLSAVMEALADDGVRTSLQPVEYQFQKGATEMLVATSGLAWNLVRASWFMQNFSESFMVEGLQAGELMLPEPRAREPFIDVDDIASMAVAALTNPALRNQLLEVTGPEFCGLCGQCGARGVGSGSPESGVSHPDVQGGGLRIGLATAIST